MWNTLLLVIFKSFSEIHYYQSYLIVLAKYITIRRIQKQQWNTLLLVIFNSINETQHGTISGISFTATVKAINVLHYYNIYLVEYNFYL